MLSGKFVLRVIAAGIAFCCLPASGQNRAVSLTSGGASEGRLSVSAAVVTSVGLVIEPDGEQRIVIANAADPKDNVSRLHSDLSKPSLALEVYGVHWVAKCHRDFSSIHSPSGRKLRPAYR